MNVGITTPSNGWNAPRTWQKWISQFLAPQSYIAGPARPPPPGRGTPAGGRGCGPIPRRSGRRPPLPSERRRARACCWRGGRRRRGSLRARRGRPPGPRRARCRRGSRRSSGNPSPGGCRLTRHSNSAIAARRPAVAARTRSEPAGFVRRSRLPAPRSVMSWNAHRGTKPARVYSENESRFIALDTSRTGLPSRSARSVIERSSRRATPPAEELRADVHDPQRNVRRARVVEARAHQPAADRRPPRRRSSRGPGPRTRRRTAASRRARRGRWPPCRAA